MKPWGQNPFFVDLTSGNSELSAAWRWTTGQTEIDHQVTYRSANTWTATETAELQTRMVCHALLDILPERSLEIILQALQAECLRYRGVDPATGYLVLLPDEDPYENSGTSKLSEQSARLFNSVLRARPSEPDERNR